MYKEWLLQKIENEAWLQTKMKDEDFENWKSRNQGRADGVDAMIYLLERFMKGGKRVEMRDDISTLIARVKCL